MKEGLAEYIQGLVKLYGVVEKLRVLDRYNEHYALPATMEELEAAAGSESVREVEQDEDQLYHADVTRFDLMEKLTPAKISRPWFEPSHEQILQWAAADYPASRPEVQSLRDAIIELGGDALDPAIADAYALRSFRGHMEGLEQDMDPVELPRQSVPSDFHARVRELAASMLKQTFSTPRWDLNGHSVVSLTDLMFTPAERTRLRKKLASSLVPPRPGRNEPCHCGSGKKYKNCCLRLDQAKDRDQASQAKDPDQEV